MSDGELRVPGYVDIDRLHEDYERRRVVSVNEFMLEAAVHRDELVIFRTPRRLTAGQVQRVKDRIRSACVGMNFVLVDESWKVEPLNAAAQRAYAAFWGVGGPVGEQWAVMSEERKDCWRGVVRAVLGS